MNMQHQNDRRYSESSSLQSYSFVVLPGAHWCSLVTVLTLTDTHLTLGFVANACPIPPDDYQKGVHANEPCVQQKQQKELLVGEPHAVVHPRTVVIHLDNAPVAHTARNKIIERAERNTKQTTSKMSSEILCVHA